MLLNFRMPRITQRTVLHAVILTCLLLFICTTILWVLIVTINLFLMVTTLVNEHHTVIPPFLLSSAVAGDNMYHIGNQSISSLYNLCVIVRTHPLHVNILPTTLNSLLSQQTYLLSTQNDDDLLTLSIFVVNTDPINYGISEFMYDAANDANRRIGYDAVKVLGSSFHATAPVKNVYGYDLTDQALDMLLLKEEDPKCTHFMFTNGDNYYPTYFLESVIPYIRKGKQLIAWDFTTHHPRKITNYIKAEIKRGKIDLGAALVTREAILNKEEGDSTIHHKRFLPNGSRTTGMFARDYFFFKEIYDQVGKENVEIIHNRHLFVHN